MHILFLFIVTTGMFTLPPASISICEKLHKEVSTRRSQIMIHRGADFLLTF